MTISEIRSARGHALYFFLHTSSCNAYTRANVTFFLRFYATWSLFRPLCRGRDDPEEANRITSRKEGRRVTCLWIVRIRRRAVVSLTFSKWCAAKSLYRCKQISSSAARSPGNDAILFNGSSSDEFFFGQSEIREKPCIDCMFSDTKNPVFDDVQTMVKSSRISVIERNRAMLAQLKRWKSSLRDTSARARARVISQLIHGSKIIYIYFSHRREPRCGERQTREFQRL